METVIQSLGWIPINIYIGGVIYSLISPNDYLISKSMDILIIRLNFLLSVTYLIYTMVIIFKNYINRNSKIWEELNSNSYGVYIIHVIVMGIVALVMLNTNIPSIIKFFTLTISTFGISSLIIYSYKKLKMTLLVKNTKIS